MKRFIAIFGIFIIITMHCLSFYPAKAAITAVDYGEMLNTYLGAAETALAASQGVTIDWSNLELPAESDTWTDKQKAQYIVQYVGNLKKVGQHAIYEWLFGEDNDTQDIISAETAAIGLSNNSNINTLDIKAQLDNILSTQSQDHVFQRYSDKIIARWNEYNTNYINEYLDQMNTLETSDIVTPPPDTPNNILDYVDYINGSGFDFIKNMPITIWQGSFGNVSQLYPSFKGLPLNYSWYSYSSSGTDNPWNKSKFSTLTSALFCSANGIDNIYITFDNVNNVYKCTLTKDNTQYNLNENYPIARGDDWNNSNWESPKGALYGNFYTYSDYLSFANCNPWYSGGWSSKTLSNATLDGLFQQLSRYVRNTNIYVDGILFSQAGTVITTGLSVTVPDAVIDSGTDDGKIVSHPIYYPDTMNTDKAIDIDLDKVVDAIAARIAAGDNDITFDDLVDAGAAIKLDGTTLTDADTIVKDVSVPIARARVDTIDGVVPTIDVVPPLPPLPPLNPGDYSGEGFSGMSVLARIINATVQGLPSPVILTFFGVIFGAVILGIIKILHH